MYNIETLNSSANLPLQNSFIKFDVAKDGSLKRAFKQAGHGKVRLNVLSYVPMYN